jgi:hypothetical protein
MKEEHRDAPVIQEAAVQVQNLVQAAKAPQLVVAEVPAGKVVAAPAVVLHDPHHLLQDQVLHPVGAGQVVKVMREVAEKAETELPVAVQVKEEAAVAVEQTAADHLVPEDLLQEAPAVKVEEAVLAVVEVRAEAQEPAVVAVAMKVEEEEAAEETAKEEAVMEEVEAIAEPVGVEVTAAADVVAAEAATVEVVVQATVAIEVAIEETPEVVVAAEAAATGVAATVETISTMI